MNQEKVVKELLRKGVNIDVIQEVTNCSIEDIAAVKSTMRRRSNRTLEEINENDVNKIYEMYLNKTSVVDISKNLKIKRMVVIELLDQKFPERKKKKLTDAEKEIIYRMYQDGENIEKISRLLTISKYHTTLLLKQKGIYRYKNKKAGKRATSKQVETILNLHKQGLTTTEIAKQVNVNQSTVARWIKKKKAL